MITELTIPSDGGFYTFPNSNVFLENALGFGNPDPKVGAHEHSNAHGAVFSSQYYKSRRITLSGIIKGVDKPALALARREFSQAFSFLNSEKLLKLTTDDNKSLQCNVMAASAVRIEPLGPDASSFLVELSAFDPLLYSQDIHSVQGGVATLTGAGFELPFSLPLALSGSVTGVANALNGGNTRIYPSLIKIIGPGTNFTLQNKTTGETLSYNGSLSAGEYINIDPRKNAYKNGVTNVFGDISSSSREWIDLYYGNNIFALTVGSGNDDDTGFVIEWRDGYLGV